MTGVYSAFCLKKSVVAGARAVSAPSPHPPRSPPLEWGGTAKASDLYRRFYQSCRPLEWPPSPGRLLSQRIPSLSGGGLGPGVWRRLYENLRISFPLRGGLGWGWGATTHVR